MITFIYRGRQSQWQQQKGWVKQVRGFDSPADAKEACEYYGWRFVCELEEEATGLAAGIGALVPSQGTVSLETPI